jgi:hypothetical protein
VALSRRLGRGVWLQAPSEPNSDSTILEPLRSYLGPLLTWTRADTGAPAPPPAATEPVDPTRINRLNDQLSHKVRPIPARFKRDAGIDTGLNLHFAEAPTPAQRSAAEKVVGGWYVEGATGSFGGVGFHELTGPTLDGRVMRWRIDFGSADSRRAVRWISRELTGIPGAPGIERIVIGTERAPDRDRTR